MPVAACLAHLDEEERENCLRARDLRTAEQRRIWAAGEPERQRLAAEAAAAKQALQAAYPCGERRPEELGTYSWGLFAPNRCKGCDSWLCASCDWVHVETEGGQCETCRPQATEPAPSGDHAQDRPHYRIKLPGLKSITEALRLLIRAGARNGGDRRVFAVDLPICDSQAEALELLETFDFGSYEAIEVKLVPEGAQARVDPSLPEPDLSSLGDTESWWQANAYPRKAADKSELR
jgi:hypothetical protein